MPFPPIHAPLIVAAMQAQKKRIETKRADEWRDMSTAPNGVVVETKVDDARGVRNVQPLKRSRNLWFLPDGSMYVYYQPTHWRPISPTKE